MHDSTPVQSEQTSQSEINIETHFSIQDFFNPSYPLPCEARNDGETIFSEIYTSRWTDRL